MRTLLFPTDFSANSNHAAEYGFNMAAQIRANIILLNAVIIPAEAPQAGLMVWPMEESDTLLKDSADELKRLQSHFEHLENSFSFKPSVRCLNETGILTDAANNIIKRENVDLVVIATHVTGALTSLLLGNHSRNMIDGIKKPLLLVPPTAHIAPIKKIAFATDFKNIDEDFASVNELISFARPMNAAIWITHIYNKEAHTAEFKIWIQQFMTDISGKANYPYIHYRLFENPTIDSGLEWLCEHEQIDILAMVHRSHTFIDSLFRGSQTQKMAGHIPIPLLVFPATPKPNL